MHRSRHQRCSVRKGVLRNFAKLTEHLCQSLFFNKVTGLRPATLLKKRLWHRCFSVNFAKFPRTPFLQNTSRRLLLHVFGYGCWWKWYDAVTKICQKKNPSEVLNQEWEFTGEFKSYNLSTLLLTLLKWVLLGPWTIDSNHSEINLQIENFCKPSRSSYRKISKPSERSNVILKAAAQHGILKLKLP